MYMSSDDAAPYPLSEALKKKRERDRRNQRRKRQRERELTENLQAKVRLLEEQLRNAGGHHDETAPIQEQTPSYTKADDRNSGLEDEANPSLQQPSRIIDISDASQDRCADIGSDNTLVSEIIDNLILFDPLQGQDPLGGPSLSVGSDDSPYHNVVLPTQSQEADHDETRNPGCSITVPLKALGTLLDMPKSLRLPRVTFQPRSEPRLLIHSEGYGLLIERLRNTPDLLGLCPEVPKVLDLLFGGSKNLLANAIALELVPYPLLPPEKFAISWLNYLFVRVLLPMRFLVGL